MKLIILLIGLLFLVAACSGPVVEQEVVEPVAEQPKRELVDSGSTYEVVEEAENELTLRCTGVDKATCQAECDSRFENTCRELGQIVGFSYSEVNVRGQVVGKCSRFCV
jgi:hypothetical protein